MERRMLTLLALCLLIAAGSAELRLKCLAQYPCGHYTPSIVLGDTDHDSLGEVILCTWDRPQPIWQIFEYRPVNRLALAKADTGMWPCPQGMISGNFVPFDIGDIDRDGKTDLVGQNWYRDSAGMHDVMCTIESRDSFSYPDSLNWCIWMESTTTIAQMFPKRHADLDRDSAGEILSFWQWGTEWGTGVFGNVGNDRESLVNMVPGWPTVRSPVADFDQNGRTDFALVWGNDIFVYECLGDNQFARVCSLHVGWPNVVETFCGNNVDGSGRPVFFVVYSRHVFLYEQYLYEFEASSQGSYQYHLVDSTLAYWPQENQSFCADLDGDGRDEVVWGDGYGERLQIYKAAEQGPHEFQRVGTWQGDSGEYTICNAADLNRNGYPEVFVAGDPRMSVLEIEAIRVEYPNARLSFTAGDTCAIRWQVYTPPRCDSVSLFLRSDSNTVNGFYRLDTIAHGLSPNDSAYSWIVPDTTLDSARILAIAYGPGWQLDESDSAFRIAPAGVAGPRIVPPRNWALSVSPNPARGAFAVSYDVPRAGRVSVGVYDADGRLTRTLARGVLTAGRYQATLTRPILPAGIYFVTLDNGGTRITQKVVLTE